MSHVTRHASRLTLHVPNPMRVNWLTYTNERDYDRVESTLWIRGYQLFPYLKELGIECLLNAPPDAAPVAVILRWQDERALDTAKAVKRAGGKIIFDTCVDYFRPSGAIAGQYGSAERQRQEALAMACVADAVTCASATVAEGARQYHSPVHVLPDSIDMRHFSRIKTDEDFRRTDLRAIWSGVGVKAREVLPVLPVLARHGVNLVLITDRDPFRRFTWQWFNAKVRLRYRFIPWHYRTFPEAILEGELCISPRDTILAYNRGHSSFKIAVFMAQGVPAVVSPVPSYVELLADGQSGWVCDDVAAWDAAIRSAVTDRRALVARSLCARERVRGLSTEAVALQYAQLFRCLVDRSALRRSEC